jgi:peroxin-3
MGESQKCDQVVRNVLDLAGLSSLRRRFNQTQENVSFTIMALLPTLGKRILEELDVESVTHELQTKSRTFRTPSEPPLSESSISSSIELLHEQDTRSDIESASASSVCGQEEGRGSFNVGGSSQSWVDQLSTQSSQLSTSRRQPSASEPPETDYLAGAQLSDSITTASSASSYVNGTGLVSTFDAATRRALMPSISLLRMASLPSLQGQARKVKPNYGGRSKCSVSYSV